MKMTKALTSQSDIDVMTACLRGVSIRLSLLWEIGVSTGLRVSDILTLKPLHLSSCTMQITEKKTKNERTLTIKSELYAKIQAYIKGLDLEEDDYLFYSPRHGRKKPMTRQWVHHVIRRISQNNGLFFIGTHSMRKTYACNLYSSYGSLNDVKNDLGHKKLETTLIYLRDLLEKDIKNKKAD